MIEVNEVALHCCVSKTLTSSGSSLACPEAASAIARSRKSRSQCLPPSGSHQDLKSSSLSPSGASASRSSRPLDLLLLSRILSCLSGILARHHHLGEGRSRLVPHLLLPCEHCFVPSAGRSAWDLDLGCIRHLSSGFHWHGPNARKIACCLLCICRAHAQLSDLSQSCWFNSTSRPSQPLFELTSFLNIGSRW